MSDGVALPPASGTARTRDVGSSVHEQIVNTPMRVIAAGTLTRPGNATAYLVNELVGDNTTVYVTCTFADLADDPIELDRIRVDSTDTGFGGKAVRVWVYNSAPSGLAADNATFASNRAGLIGTFIGTLKTLANGSWGALSCEDGASVKGFPGSGAQTLWLVLQVLEGVTPSGSSTTFIFTLEGRQGRD